MKLPYRIDVIEECTLRELSGADLALVRRTGQDGDIYSAFLEFATCATKSLGNIEDRAQIREMYLKATFDTVYAVAVRGMALTRGVDRVEGYYQCSCGSRLDHTGEYADPFPEYECEDALPVTYECDVHIVNQKTGEDVLCAQSVTLRRPTVADLIRCYRRYPDDETEMQFQIYKDCLVALDGREVDEKTRNAYGDLVFKKMPYRTLNKLSSLLVSKWGEVECVCMKCKRRWKAQLDLTSFFDLGAD